MPRDDEWMAALAARFEEVARRRVPEDDVADIVQDALRVVHERGRSVSDATGPPPLPWCHQVLRNLIGNYYRRRRVRGQVVPLDEPTGGSLEGGLPTPIEALETREAMRAIRSALLQMSEDDAQCGRLLGRVLDGVSSRQIALENDLKEPVLYRRLYRCRQKLRRLLNERGIIT